MAGQEKVGMRQPLLGAADEVEYNLWDTIYFLEIVASNLWKKLPCISSGHSEELALLACEYE